jgi:hypothetical protein
VIAASEIAMSCQLRERLVALGAELLEQPGMSGISHDEAWRAQPPVSKQTPTDLPDLLRRQVERGGSLPTGGSGGPRQGPAQPGSGACLGQIPIAEKGR